MSLGGGGSDIAEKTAKSSSKQLSIATEKSYGVADDLVDFVNDFYTTYLEPQIAKVNEASDVATQRNAETYGAQKAQYEDREATYQQVGKPAIEQFQNTARDFSTAEYAESEAMRGIGDVAAQENNFTGQQNRALAARGLKQNQGTIAQSGMTFALAKAAAANRARDLAKNQGLILQNQAANIGVGLSQLAPGITNQTNSTIGQGAQIPQTAAVTTAAMGQPVADAYKSAGGIYSNIGSQYASLTGSTVATAQRASEAEAEGWGKLGGTILGAGLSLFPGTQPAGLALLGASAKS